MKRPEIGLKYLRFAASQWMPNAMTKLAQMQIINSEERFQLMRNAYSVHPNVASHGMAQLLVKNVKEKFLKSSEIYFYGYALKKMEGRMEEYLNYVDSKELGVFPRVKVDLKGAKSAIEATIENYQKKKFQTQSEVISLLLCWKKPNQSDILTRVPRDVILLIAKQVWNLRMI